VAAIDGLAAAITKAKGFNGSGVVLLTADFYTDANSKNTALVIDAATERNTQPYTIRGTGAADTLSVGVLLANDNVTLEKVKIEVPNKAAAAKTASGNYFAALSITRSSDGSTMLTAENEANNHVTVQDCDISYTAATNMAAGIYVSGLPAAPPDVINITGNDITVNNTGTSATQAIMIRTYQPSVVITNNVLTSTGNAAANSDAPVSALILQIHPDYTTGQEPAVTGNTLNGVRFDFYVTIYGHGTEDGNFVGAPALFGDKFGTAETTWVKAEGENASFYKQLLTALLPQVKGGSGDGFGRFFMQLGKATATRDAVNFALEYYEISGGAITAINYWSPDIEGQAYKNTAMTNENINTTTGVRARLPLTGGDENETFNWTRTVPGTNLPGI
jgi:hypothetical protein